MGPNLRMFKFKNILLSENCYYQKILNFCHRLMYTSQQLLYFLSDPDRFETTGAILLFAVRFKNQYKTNKLKKQVQDKRQKPKQKSFVMLTRL